MFRAGVTLALCLLAPAVATGAAGADPLDPGQPDVLSFATRDTGRTAGEPTLGTLADGTVVYQAMTTTLTTRDDGVTWQVAHNPPVTTTLDPYVHVDRATGRVIASQLLGACQLLSLSSDGGVTWTDAPTQCGTGDHQKIGSGPWTAAGASPLFPSAVYTCVNHVVDTACAISPDGGLSWGPLVTAFPGVDPLADAGVGGVTGLCGGLEGDPAVAPDGTVYLPREYCGRPYLGISTDSGLTWTRQRVGSPDSRTLPIGYGANNPSVAVAADGDVYYAWTDGQYRHRVARSADHGRTWTETLVSDPHLTSTTFPFVIAGDDGRVATGFLGASGGKPGDPGDVGNDAVWHLYLAVSTDADAATPAYTVAQATPVGDPVMRGCVGRHAGSCSGHTSLLDFNDAALLPDGRLVVSYVDACVPPACKNSTTSSESRGYLAVQTGGPRIVVGKV